MTKQNKILIIGGLAVSLVLGGVVSYWASSSPDGLERVAEDHGFLDKEQQSQLQKDGSPIPGYEMPGVQNNFLKVSLAGIVGTLACFGLALLLGWVLKRRKKQATTA